MTDDRTDDTEPTEPITPADEVGTDRTGDGPSTDEVTTDAPEDTGRTDGEAAEAGETQPRPVVRRKVVSKRVTPKGGGPARSSGPATKAWLAEAQERARKQNLGVDEPVDLDEDLRAAQRRQAAAQLPSPWWVPALMFGLIVIGGLVIILNYMGAFGDPSNVRLIIGLVFILGGIITATQYR